jgi:hypothetical protein
MKYYFVLYPFHPYHATITKQIKGTIYALAVDLSESIPITYGTNAPPTMDIIIKDAPFLVWCPRSFTPKAKMVGNMMDSKKKTAINE